MTTTATSTAAIDRESTREEILDEIKQLEMRLTELRAILPSSFKTLFRFRCSPANQKVWVYAATRSEADAKLHQKMSQDYGPDGWQLISKVVEEFDHPDQAVGLTEGNLLHSLGKADAELLFQDWQQDQKGRSANRPKGLKTRLERDIEAYQRLRQV